MAGFRLRLGTFVACLLWLPQFTHADSKPPTRQRPDGLSAGDSIMPVAPAGPVRREAIDRIDQYLTRRGFRVVVPERITRQRGYLAGTDEQRAAELMTAFLDDDVDAIFPVTGGFGTTRILDRLDYDKIRGLKRAKIVIGFSDITGYLSQLRLAGKLRAPAAIILGQFTDAEPDATQESLSMRQVFDDYFRDAKYPVVANFPAGHTRNNATLPLGMDIRVKTREGRPPTITVVHDPVFATARSAKR